MAGIPKNLNRKTLNIFIDSIRSDNPKLHSGLARARAITEKRAGRWAHATPKDVNIEWMKRRMAADIYSSARYRELRTGIVTKKMSAIARRQKLLELYQDIRLRVRLFTNTRMFKEAGFAPDELRTIANSALLSLVPKKAKAKGTDITLGEIEEVIKLAEHDIEIE